MSGILIILKLGSIVKWRDCKNVTLIHGNDLVVAILSYTVL